MTDGDQMLHCDCCGRAKPRRVLHAIGEPASYICRRCGLYVATRLKRDD